MTFLLYIVQSHELREHLPIILPPPLCIIKVLKENCLITTEALSFHKNFSFEYDTKRILIFSIAAAHSVYNHHCINDNLSSTSLQSDENALSLLLCYSSGSHSTNFVPPNKINTLKHCWSTGDGNLKLVKFANKTWIYIYTRE